MNLEILDDSGSVIKLGLSGRLDTKGVDLIETRFTAVCVPKEKDVVVDMSQVEFLASMGIRMLVSVAKAMKLKGKRLVLLSPRALVTEVIVLASLDEILPIVESDAEALTLLG